MAPGHHEVSNGFSIKKIFLICITNKSRTRTSVCFFSLVHLSQLYHVFCQELPINEPRDG